MSQLIVGFGEALVDVLPSGEVVGGAPLNFAVRAAQLGSRLGCDAALITRIGQDARGQQIREHLQRTQLQLTGLQIDAQHPTGFVDVTLHDGHPSYVIGEHVAWDHIVADDVALELSSQADVFCFGTLAQRETTTTNSLASCLKAAEHAIKIFDINLRHPFPPLKLIEDSLHHADVLKCNTDELQLLAEWLLTPIKDQTAGPQRSEPAPWKALEQIAAQLQTQFELTSVFWTRGASGCVLQRGSQLIQAAVPQLPQALDADSVGAGDAAAAALAVGVAFQWPADKIVAVANHCGALAASQRGATTPFPEEFLRQL